MLTKQRQTGNPFMNPARANPFSTSNTPANYYPQGSTNSPQGFVPPTQPSDAKTARQKIDELMKKLMSGESLTTEELMSLQRWD